MKLLLKVNIRQFKSAVLTILMIVIGVFLIIIANCFFSGIGDTTEIIYLLITVFSAFLIGGGVIDFLNDYRRLNKKRKPSK